MSFLFDCSEKSELILKTNFLTILFPVDRFSEMGPCSRTFFSEKGFTCLQVLDYIHAFYQVLGFSLARFAAFIYGGDFGEFLGLFQEWIPNRKISLPKTLRL